MEIKYKNKIIIFNMEFNTNGNKELIWNLLQENNVFDGINNKKMNKIQAIFEETIQNIELTQSKNNLMTKNKNAMEEIILKIGNERDKPNKVEMIYTSDGLSKHRRETFDNKLKQQQDNLNTYTHPKIPDKPNFNDDIDTPIGDDMDKLIAERLASRERELDVPHITKEAEKWLNNGTREKNNFLQKTPSETDKKVTFNLQSQNTTVLTKSIIEDDINMNVLKDDKSSIKLEVSDFFSKLKRNTSENIVIKEHNQNEFNNQGEFDIKNEFKILKENQESIMDLCQLIIDKLDDRFQ